MSVPLRTRTLAAVIFGVALFGILVVTHLGLQVRAGFPNGCTGLGGVDYTAVTTATEASGCADVATGEYSDFLGLSNILWGLGFYTIVGLLRLFYGISGDDRVRMAAFGVVGVGFLYTLYLVYLQAVVIGSFCPLCMTSAATVTVLLALHLLEQRKLATGERHSAPPPPRAAAVRPYAVAAGAFAVLLAADVALAGDPAPEAPENGNAQASGESDREEGAPPTTLTPTLPSGCAYDPQFGPVANLEPFLDNPSKGTGPVQVVEIFDPNCPHCRDLHETMRGVIQDNAGAATFYSVAYPLRQPTVAQATSLYWANDRERYFELKDQMFERLDASWGMELDELRDAANAVGLDGPSMVASLQNAADDAAMQGYLAEVQEDAEAVQAALNNQISTPKLIINGRIVAPTAEAYTERCLNQFIADAGAPAEAPAAVVEEVQ